MLVTLINGGAGHILQISYICGDFKLDGCICVNVCIIYAIFLFDHFS